MAIGSSVSGGKDLGKGSSFSLFFGAQGIVVVDARVLQKAPELFRLVFAADEEDWMGDKASLALPSPSTGFPEVSFCLFRSLYMCVDHLARRAFSW